MYTIDDPVVEARYKALERAVRTGTVDGLSEVMRRVEAIMSRHQEIDARRSPGEERAKLRLV